MTGWRVGYLLADVSLVPNMAKIQEGIVSCVPAFLQIAAAEALTRTDCVEQMREEYASRLEKMKVHAAELEETEPGAYGDIVQIPVKGASDKEFTEISVNLEEIQQVFAIMQMNTDEGAKVISDVTSENVLILLHAADSRKMIRNAAKERANKLFLSEDDLNESSKGNEPAEAGTEGVDA